MQALARFGLGVNRLRPVLPRINRAPNLFLAMCDFSSGETVNLSPLILFDEEGNTTSEAQKIFAGRVYDSTSD